ncbi:hypothetical protein HE1_00283 [Holospora elegans E1]|uniref:Uncharacterized protein n=1 Tax=Holospora elegans E1 TaxID=1427503 RepID=A0A023DYE3_9PROT|nr:hypothetical protein [Holospora elegans]GAJ45965.1 hypothetical protein HE1_00283 [Holospora elegans E1]
MNFSIWFICLMMPAMGCGQSYLQYSADFMESLLSSGKAMIGKILQPAVTRHGEDLLEKHSLASLKKDKLSISKIVQKIEKEDSKESSKKILMKKNDLGSKEKATEPYKRKKEEKKYMGPLRNIPKKNWRKKPGSIGLHDPVSQELFSETQDPLWRSWESFDNRSELERTVAPVEILLGLGRCLNEAASLTLSPSGRNVDIDKVFFDSDFFSKESPFLFKKAARRFETKGDYRMVGADINNPFNPMVWNIQSIVPVSVQKKKRALGLCLHLNNNTAFTVMTPRYTQEGRVRRNHAIVQDLEKQCSRYPYTFLSSMFVPG